MAHADDGILWKYKNSTWSSITNRGIYNAERFFALSEDDIWASGKVPGIYREILFDYDGRRWQRMPSPNLHNIRTIYFRAPDDGWIGGEYGELWHYDGKNWQREKLPVQLHVNRLLLRWNGELLAFVDAPFQTAYLRREQEGWKLFMRGDGDNGLALSPRDDLYVLQRPKLSYP